MRELRKSKTAAGSIAPYINGLLSYMQGYYRKMVRTNRPRMEFEQLLICLSRNLHYLNDRHPYASVPEEIRFIEEYMKFQKMKNDRIQYESRIGANISHYSIRRFVLFSCLEDMIGNHFEYCRDDLTVSLESQGDREIILGRIIGTERETFARIRVRKKKYEMIYRIRRQGK